MIKIEDNRTCNFSSRFLTYSVGSKRPGEGLRLIDRIRPRFTVARTPRANRSAGNQNLDIKYIRTQDYITIRQNLYNLHTTRANVQFAYSRPKYRWSRQPEVSGRATDAKRFTDTCHTAVAPSYLL